LSNKSKTGPDYASFNTTVFGGGHCNTMTRQCDNYNAKSHRRRNNMSRMNPSGYEGQ